MAKKKKMNVVVNQPKDLAQEVPKEKPSFFPKLLMLISLLLIALALINLFNLWAIPNIVTNIALLLASLWLLKVGFEKGFVKRRKEILKKYI